MFCPECGNEYNEGAVYCNSCGNKLPQNVKTEPKVVEKKFCTQCGSEYSPGAEYCPGCGQNLHGSPSVEPKAVKDTGPSPGNEQLLEIVNVALTGLNPPKKILHFTDKNIYVTKGSFLAGGMGESLGWVAGGFIGSKIGKKMEKDNKAEIEETARSMNFQDMAANNPDVIVIPYNEIVTLKLARRSRLLNPAITIQTASEEFNYIMRDYKNYEKYFETIPSILGDKVIME